MADTTINDLSPLIPSTGLYLPVTNGSNTGKVTLAEVCGVMTSNQITNALGYTPVQPTSPALAKAWVSFDGTRDTTGNVSTLNTNRLLRGSYNISSVLRNASGDYTVNFNPAMPDRNYCVQITSGSANGRYATIYNLNTWKPYDYVLASSVRIMIEYSTASPDKRDLDSIHVVIYSN